MFTRQLHVRVLVRRSFRVHMSCVHSSHFGQLLLVVNPFPSRADEKSEGL